MSEKKEPPSDGRDVLALVLVDDVQTVLVVTYHARQGHPIHWRTPGRGMMFRVVDVVDWCEIPAWPDLVAAPGAAARLADAQARLDKAEQHARALEASVEQERRLLRHASEERELFRKSVLHERAFNKALQSRVLELEAAAEAAAATEASEKHAWVVANETANERDTLGRERDAALARAELAEKERDEAVEWRREVAEALDVIKNNGVIADVDYAVRHARALRHVADQRHDAMDRADQAIRERDEVGCQLEALRAVQRDDLQVLVARIALVEADVAVLHGMKPRKSFPLGAHPLPGTTFLLPCEVGEGGSLWFWSSRVKTQLTYEIDERRKGSTFSNRKTYAVSPDQVNDVVGVCPPVATDMSDDDKSKEDTDAEGD